jgi:predicted TPR repeat methyltransferase
MSSGRLDAARSEAQRLCRLHPGQPALFNLLGVVLARSGRGEDALEAFRRALELEPAFNEARANLASVLQENGRHLEAVRCYQELVHRGEQSPELYGSLAKALRGAGMLDDALEAGRRALKLKPAFPDALNDMGNVLNEMGRHDESIEAYEGALAINARHGRALLNLARSLYALRKHQDALAVLQRYLALDANDAAALRLKAHALLGIGQSTAAAETLERVLSLNPEDRVSRHLLGAISGRGSPEGDPEYARAVFDAYAARFEAHLTEKLEYRVPEKIPRVLQALDGENAWYERAVDLGCGTGLVGTQLRSFCSHLTGVDVSAAMMEKAKEKAVYDELVVDDVLGWLRGGSDRYELLLCIETLLYIGALDGFLEAAKRRMEPGARLVFTTEREEGDGFTLRKTGRFAHSDAYVQECARRAGLAVIHGETLGLRKESGVWLDGGIFVVSQG